MRRDAATTTASKLGQIYLEHAVVMVGSIDCIISTGKGAQLIRKWRVTPANIAPAAAGAASAAVVARRYTTGDGFTDLD